MNVDLFQQLLSPQGRLALKFAYSLAPTPETYLRCITQMERTISRDLARICLDTVLLRERAGKKYSKAERMYFTREALEQATGECVSAYRALKFQHFAKVGDFACGIGGDTLALAENSAVIAVDQDPLRIAMATENVKPYGVSDSVEFRQSDLTTMPFPDVEAVFFDPARRHNDKRVLSIHQYQPSLSILDRWFPHTKAIAVKIAPGVSRKEIQSLDCEVEFISQNGELKECVLWFGPLRTANRRATLLPNQESLTDAVSPDDRPSGPPEQFFFEPDPAILRAGLVTHLAELISAHQLDKEIAYLSAKHPAQTPFAKTYQIDCSMTFHLKRMRETLRSMNVGQLIIKKRGSPIDPNKLMKQLKLSGEESRFLFLTRVSGVHTAIIAHPC